MGQNKHSVDVIVIGAGIAGLSLASELSTHASVIVVERETQPGYHATGRSAAYFSPAYGNATVRGLSEASEDFYKSPPDGFSPVALLQERDALHIVPKGQEQVLARSIQRVSTLNELSVRDALERVPILEPNYVSTNADVNAIEQHGDQYRVSCTQQQLSAPVVVNAGGAWADTIATRAGVAPLNLIPKRRTAFLVPAPEALTTQNWPLVINQSDPLYFKPDAGALLLSPMDETPGPPCDAAPEELDVAEAIARFGSPARGAMACKRRPRYHDWLPG